ncbi:MAG: ComEA family DNA-binding protein [Arachnia sp.]
MEHVDAAEVARARLAYISAGHESIGGPRRAEGSDLSATDDAVAGASVAAPARPGRAQAPVRGSRWRLPRGITMRHIGVVALLLLSGVGVAVAALSQSAATELPVVPVVSPPPVSAGTASPSASPRTVRVHVVGAVARPGVVTLPEGAIVLDAIEAAGGLKRDADPALLNLAAPVADGAQVVIGTAGEPLGEVRDPAGGSGATGGGGPLDLNAASVAELEELPGIGPVTAAAIVAWREENGRFTSVEELEEISGIGPKTLERLRGLVRT